VADCEGGAAVAAGAGEGGAAFLPRLTKNTIPPTIAPSTTRQGTTMHSRVKNGLMFSSKINVPPLGYDGISAFGRNSYKLYPKRLVEEFAYLKRVKHFMGFLTDMPLKMEQS
jgi:hypothetical protein